MSTVSIAPYGKRRCAWKKCRRTFIRSKAWQKFHNDSCRMAHWNAEMRSNAKKYAEAVKNGTIK